TVKALSFEQYERLSEGGGSVPVYREIPGDLQTPVSAFLALAEGKEQAFLLESVIGGERLARYSFLGREPEATLSTGLDRVTLRDREGTRTVDGGLLSALRARLGPPAAEIAGLPRFTGGADRKSTRLN